MSLTAEKREEIRAAKDQAARGRLPERVPDPRRGQRRRRQFVTPQEALTERQREVLRLAALGLRESASARLLGVSPQTIKSHMRLAKLRLEAKNTPHLIALAIRRGLLW